MRGRNRSAQTPSISSGQKKLADVKAYFTSFYKATIKDEPRDRHTIPGVTEVESRFHYNATENSIIRALLAVEPLPPGAETWHFLQARREWSVLDIGSGTGHWIDFFRDVFFAKHVTGIEIVPAMALWLQQKYADDSTVQILEADISDSAFKSVQTYDVINAIGVMFHIVDDVHWIAALKNLVAATKPGGLLLLGGDFGGETRDVQFHRRDTFESWQEHDALADDEIIINKRLRSLVAWKKVAHDYGLEIVTLIRSDSDPAISTPENDLLVLRKPA